MDEKQNGSNFVKYMSNPRAFTLKKWFYDMLKLDYAAHDTIIERISSSLTTQKDVEDFGKLIGQVYETAYKKAVEDYKAEAEKLGLKVSVVAPKPAEA